ncbi:hypothetical protein SESBI_19282 [Sesbania bispinosa]|nr:hypothetical protein SESBI_19282 [Sesbania bispinosa]
MVCKQPTYWSQIRRRRPLNLGLLLAVASLPSQSSSSQPRQHHHRSPCHDHATIIIYLVATEPPSTQISSSWSRHCRHRFPLRCGCTTVLTAIPPFAEAWSKYVG